MAHLEPKVLHEPFGDGYMPVCILKSVKAVQDPIRRISFISMAVIIQNYLGLMSLFSIDTSRIINFSVLLFLVMGKME